MAASENARYAAAYTLLVFLSLTLLVRRQKKFCSVRRSTHSLPAAALFVFAAFVCCSACLFSLSASFIKRFLKRAFVNCVPLSGTGADCCAYRLTRTGPKKAACSCNERVRNVRDASCRISSLFLLFLTCKSATAKKKKARTHIFARSFSLFLASHMVWWWLYMCLV